MPDRFENQSSEKEGVVEDKSPSDSAFLQKSPEKRGLEPLTRSPKEDSEVIPEDFIGDVIGDVGSDLGRKLGLRNVDFLQEILEKEVLPGQVIREFTQNSIQAIQARCVRENLRETRGIVQWSMYPLSFERFSAAKLACTDTGEGMNGEELAEYIGNLASSGREQGVGANFGFGAKISAMKYNPAGVIYETWQNGEGHRAILFRDQNDDVRLRYFNEGEVLYLDDQPLVQKIPAEEMPSLISENGGFGTMVIFLGEEEKKSDTTAVPKDHDGKKDDWVAWTLSHRYFSFPKGIDIRTAINHSKNPRKWNRVDGVEDFLERNHKDKGVIYLPGLEILWYTLKHHRAYTQEKSIFDSGAKIAFLYEEELYNYRTESSAQSKMQHSLGIPFNANKIALFFRPEKADITVTRASLKINNLDPPEEDWFRAFKKNMPDAIKKMIVRQEDASLEKSTHYKGLMGFLRSQRRIQVSQSGNQKGGKVEVVTAAKQTEQSISVSDQEKSKEADGITKTTEDSKTPALLQGNLQKTTVLKKGAEQKARARLLPPEALAPKCTWVKEKEAGMVGVAGRYLESENKLLLNENFPVIRRLIRSWQDKKAEDQKENVALAIKKLIAVQAIDEVINIKRLEGQEGWDSAKVKEMLQDDHALTMGLSNLYYMNKAVHNSIQNLPSRESSD